MVRVGDIAMYYERHGAGQPLLLIPGLGADISLFGPAITQLARGCEVVAFDNRGAGRTDKPDTPYTIQMLAGDAAGLMDALSIARADVLGISMGGRIAIELALSCPSRVGKLVLVSTSAAGRGRLVKSWPMRLLTLLEWLPVFRGAHPQPRYAHLRQRQAAVTYNGSDRVAGIAAPTLILHGRRDRTVPLDMAKRLHACIPGAQLELFRGGHMFFMLSQQRQALDRVSAFLRGTRRPGQASL